MINNSIKLEYTDKPSLTTLTSTKAPIYLNSFMVLIPI